MKVQIVLNVDLKEASDHDILHTIYGVTYLIMSKGLSKQSLSNAVNVMDKSTHELKKRY